MAALYSCTLEDSAIAGDRLCAEVREQGELYIRIFAFDGTADWCTTDHDKLRKLRDLIDRALEC